MDDAIEELFVQTSNSTKFPKSFSLFFTNVKVIRIYDSKIESLTSEDLKTFTNLEEIYMPSNALTIIQSDLFLTNKNLQIINFEANDLMKIGIGTFLNLKNLTSVNLRKNLNFDFSAEDRNEVLGYLSVFKQNYSDFLIYDVVECSFGTITISYLNNVYYCEGLNAHLDVEFHFAFGNHSEGKNDEDVKAFLLKHSNIHTFPVDLQKIFVNLEGIKITDSPMREIPENAFHNLTNLISVDLSNNKIHQIHPGTFKNNEKLIFIDFSQNELVFIAMDIFENKKLVMADFSGNKCIDEPGAIELEVEELKKEIEKSCNN